MTRLSVILITFNEEKNIERCLRSIQWADEIIVVDSFSTDSTIDIAKKFTNNILQHEYDGDIRQRERGFAMATGEWLMYIDADEEVTNELQSQLLEAIKNPGGKSGFSFLILLSSQPPEIHNPILPRANSASISRCVSIKPKRDN